MAFLTPDRVKETTTTTGTGTVTLAGAVTGFRSFSSALSVSDTTYYCITNGTAWEVGVGTLATATTLARTTVIASSNSNTLVSFAAGSKDVFVTVSGGVTNSLLPDETIGLFSFGTTTTPSASLDSSAHLFSRTIAGRTLPAFVGPSGLDSAIQPFFGRNKVAVFQPFPGQTTLTGVGVSPSATGNATAKTSASTNIYTQTSGIEFLVTTASTSAVAGFRCATASSGLSFWRGNAANFGGFMMVIRFGLPTGVSTSSNARVFVGMSNLTNSPTDVNPSSLTSNHNFGVGYDSTDANWQIMTNAATTMTKVDTGIAVPTTNGNEVFEISLFCPPNASYINYQFSLLSAGTVFAGQQTTNLPSSTTFMSPRGYHSVGGTSSVTGFGLMGIYVESDT